MSFKEIYKNNLLNLNFFLFFLFSHFSHFFSNFMKTKDKGLESYAQDIAIFFY